MAYQFITLLISLLLTSNYLSSNKAQANNPKNSNLQEFLTEEMQRDFKEYPDLGVKSYLGGKTNDLIYPAIEKVTPLLDYKKIQVKTFELNPNNDLAELSIRVIGDMPVEVLNENKDVLINVTPLDGEIVYESNMYESTFKEIRKSTTLEQRGAEVVQVSFEHKSGIHIWGNMLITFNNNDGSTLVWPSDFNKLHQVFGFNGSRWETIENTHLKKLNEYTPEEYQFFVRLQENIRGIIWIDNREVNKLKSRFKDQEYYQQITTIKSEGVTHDITMGVIENPSSTIYYRNGLVYDPCHTENLTLMREGDSFTIQPCIVSRQLL